MGALRTPMVTRFRASLIVCAVLGFLVPLLRLKTLPKPVDGAPAARKATDSSSGREPGEVSFYRRLEENRETPETDLLPPPPRIAFSTANFVDLATAPEIVLERPAANARRTPLGQSFVKVEILNRREPEGFVKALVRNRPDLAGLPFTLGAACRQEEPLRSFFKEAATALPRESHEVRGWLLAKDPKWMTTTQRQAFVAVLLHRLGPATSAMPNVLPEYFARIPDVVATQALATLAVFSAEADVRTAAIAVLKERPHKDYTSLLQKGIRYPWPRIAQQSLAAIVALRRKDLIPELVSFLGEPDPRLPVGTNKVGSSNHVVRELVRIEHGRNCLLCHSPVATWNVPAGVLTAPVPSSDVPYHESNDHPLLPRVRIDVTYLRPDFSIMEGGGVQRRVDYLVRSRVITEREAGPYRQELMLPEGKLNPYQSATLRAIRALGADAPHR